MKTNGIEFEVNDSDSRIQEILNASDISFEEVESIPPSERLTYSNGFYVYCTALFIDIRGSSKLPELHTRPVLAKIYRAYLSECVAILNQDENCKEIFITGDCVAGIFDTPTNEAISSAFFRAGQLNTMLKLLNWRLQQKNYSPIKCGIGIDYGRALMLKAGFRGSGINEIIWMGDVINNSSKLCHEGNRDSLKPIQASSSIYQNLREDYKELLSPVINSVLDVINPNSYEGDLVAVEMNAEIESKMSSGSISLAQILMNYHPEIASSENASGRMVRPKGLFDFL